MPIFNRGRFVAIFCAVLFSQLCFAAEPVPNLELGNNNRISVTRHELTIHRRWLRHLGRGPQAERHVWYGGAIRVQANGRDFPIPVLIPTSCSTEDAARLWMQTNYSTLLTESGALLNEIRHHVSANLSDDAALIYSILCTASQLPTRQRLNRQRLSRVILAAGGHETPAVAGYLAPVISRWIQNMRNRCGHDQPRIPNRDFTISTT